MELALIKKLAKAKGIDHLSISKTTFKQQNLEYSNNYFEKTIGSIGNGLMISAFIDGNKLSQSISFPNEKKVNLALTNLLELAKYKTKEIDQAPLAKSANYLSVKEKPFSIPDTKQIKEIIVQLSQAINKAHPAIIKENTIIRYQVNEINNTLVNSNDLALHSAQGKAFWITGEVFAKDQEKQAQVYLLRVFNNIKQIDIQDICLEVKEEINRQLIKKDITNGDYEIIFDEDIFLDLAKGAFAHLSGRQVIDKYSIWKDKLNKQVTAPELTLIDKPIVPEWGIYLTYDSDGYPTKENILIEKGILKSFIHNQKTSEILQQKNTGNATGEGVNFHNLFIKPGKIKKADLIKQTNNGVLIADVRGLHSGFNVTSGDFSLEFTGNLIIEGQVKEAIKAGVISGNIFTDVLAHASLIAQEINLLKHQSSPAIKLSKKLAISV